jgi:hypothetical protein
VVKDREMVAWTKRNDANTARVVSKAYMYNKHVQP